MFADLSECRRFFSKVTVDVTSGCWLWTGSCPRGYGHFRRTGGKLARSHRVAFEHFVGAIPQGRELDHVCRTKACVNPAHLEAVTHQENSARAADRMWGALVTQCPAGHPYDAENTRYNSDGARECRACRNGRKRARRASDPDYRQRQIETLRRSIQRTRTQENRDA